MTMVDCHKEFAHNGGSLLLGKQVLVVGQLFEQFAAIAVLHDQVDVVRRLVSLVVFDDVGVVEDRKNLYLLAQLLDLILDFLL